jgi:hypothetical protein
MFIMGVLFLILAPLVIAIKTATQLKANLTTLACAGSLGEITSEWLIRYVS